MQIRKNDVVKVIAGKDRGKSGKVLRVDPARARVWVQGLNMIKRHQRPSQLRPTAPSGVIEQEAPIHISNVMLADPRDGRPTRVRVQRGPGGERRRIAVRSGAAID